MRVEAVPLAEGFSAYEEMWSGRQTTYTQMVLHVVELRIHLWVKRTGANPQDTRRVRQWAWLDRVEPAFQTHVRAHKCKCSSAWARGNHIGLVPFAPSSMSSLVDNMVGVLGFECRLSCNMAQELILLPSGG